MNCPICKKEIIKKPNQTNVIYCSDECKREGKKIVNRIWYENNQTRLKEQFQERYPKVKEQYLKKKRDKYSSNISYRNIIKENSKRRYHENKEQVKSKINNYRNENKDIINKKKRDWAKVTGYNLEYYRKNAERKKAYKRNYIKTKIGKFKANFSNANRRAMLNNVIHDFTEEQWKKKLEDSKGICMACEKYTGDNLTMDHDYSLFKANKDYSTTGIKRRYTIDNINPICTSCNSSKKDKDKDEWRHMKSIRTKPNINYLFEAEAGDKSKDTTFASIWLFRGYKKIPIAEDPFHNINSVNNLREKYYSRFSPLTAECIINYWSEPSDLILDIFAGRTRAIVSSLKNREYIGFEVSKKVADTMNTQIKKGIESKELSETLPPRIINDDCLNLDKYINRKVNFIFTCPPYFNLEKYESCEGQLSDINKYEDFLKELKIRLSKACNLLEQNKYAAIVIGDFRRDNKFYVLHKELIQLMEDIGMTVHDIIILQTVTWDVASFRFSQLRNSKKVSKVHEYLLIFKKIKNKE